MTPTHFTQGDHPMTGALNRRTFLAHSAAATGMLASGYYINGLPAQESKSPNERLNIASVGTVNRAGANLGGVASQNIIALADIDANSLEQAAARYPAANKYRDFRVMLEKEADKLDAVLVSTPDHVHAPAAAMALRFKKHVYCEKPLTHTVFEARTLAELAKKNKLVTQMGTQIHAGDNYRRVVELVQSGAIGPVTEAHVWAGAVYTGGRFTTGTPAPPHVDWDLWLGPAPQRPYSEGCHPFHWRRFWDYGTGSLGDFGCHFMDLAHWALKLKHPTRIAASGPEVDTVSTPAWCIVDYDYPARENMPPVKLTWYDSGKRPERLASLRDADGKPLDWGGGQLFVGTEGMILSDYSRHLLLPADRFAGFKRPEPLIPASIGHHAEWVEAIKSGGSTTCNFDYSGALTEAVLLGTVAYRAGEPLAWDGAQFKITNSARGQQLLHKEYRKGWEL
jgi:predicted dehydrogenase